MASGPGPVLAGYPAAVAGALARVLGPVLVGIYLHGSAALGGWSAELSDVDLLGVVATSLDRRAKRVVSARLNHPSLVCPAEAGLEMSLVTAAVAADPPRRPPFELHVTTAAAAPTTAPPTTVEAAPETTRPAPHGLIAAGHRKPAPPLHVTDFDGRTITLGGFRGQPVVVNFFESW